MTDPRFDPRAPRLGQHIPEATLQTEDGKPLLLSALARGSPLILLFFGGSDDVQGVRRLLEFRDLTMAFKHAGARIAAVSTDGPSLSAFLRSERALGFPILSDEEGKASAAFGMLDGEQARSAGFLIDAKLVVRKRWLGAQITVGDLLTAVKRGGARPQDGKGEGKGGRRFSRLRQILSSIQHAFKPARLVR